MNQTMTEIINFGMEMIFEPWFKYERTGFFTDKQKESIAKGKIADIRPSNLVSKSAKGGSDFFWLEKVKQQKVKRSYKNVSCADHFVSTATGATTFVFYQCKQDKADEHTTKKLMFLVFVIGLFHDLNKLIGCKEISNKKVKEYLILLNDQIKFIDTLSQFDLILTIDDVFYLMCHVETDSSTHTGWLTLDKSLLGVVEKYVRLADKLEGVLYKHGIEEVVNELTKNKNLLPAEYQELDHFHFYYPHAPLLLDELLRCIIVSSNQYNHAPVVAQVENGHFHVVLKKTIASQVIEQALENLSCYLSPQFDIHFSTKQLPSILGNVGSLQDVATFLKDNSHVIESLLTVSIADIKQVMALLERVENIPLAPKDYDEEKHKVLRFKVDRDAESFVLLSEIAQMKLLLSLSNDREKGKKKRYLSIAEREQFFFDIMSKYDYELPELSELTTISRPTVIAILLMDFIAKHPSAQGDIGQVFSDFYISYTDAYHYDDISITQVQTVVAELRSFILKGFYVNPAMAGEACLISGQFGGKSVKATDNLYALKVSAFSTRQGRSSKVGDAKGSSSLAPIPYIEHTLKTTLNGTAKGKQPVSICSPISVGLFSTVRFNVNEKQYFNDYSSFDLCRAKYDKDKPVLTGYEMFLHPQRLCRLESVSNNTVDFINDLDRLVRVVMRTGRALHVFKGAPEARHEILYFDYLPTRIEKLLGKQGFTIEELPPLLQKIQLAKALIEVRSLSFIDMLYSPDLFQRYLVMSHLITSIEVLEKSKLDRFAILTNLEEQLMDISKKINANPILLLAGLASKIQHPFMLFSSKSEQLLVFDICMQHCIKFSDKPELISAIEGRLHEKVISQRYGVKKEYMNGLSTEIACHEIAEYFVDEIWCKLFASKPVSRTIRRFYSDAYRVEMTKIFRSRKKTNEEGEV